MPRSQLGPAAVRFDMVGGKKDVEGISPDYQIHGVGGDPDASVFAGYNAHVYLARLEVKSPPKE